METFMTTSKIILPIFLIIALGYALRFTGTIDDDGCTKMNKLAFRVFIPAMVFHNIYRSDAQVLTNMKIISFAVVSMTGLFVLLMAVIPLIEKDNERRGVMVQGIFRSSFVVLGMGIVTSVYPSGNTGVTAMLSAVVAPMFNAFAVIALETFSTQKPDLKRISINIATNPLIVASVAAIVMVALKVRLPSILEIAISDLSGVATPFALLVSGAAFHFSSVGDRARQLVIVCVGKLIAVPLVFVTISVMLGFRGVELLSLLVFFGSPVSVSSHIMAFNSGGDEQLAGQVVVFSTCLSAITLFAFIYVLLSMGLI